MERKIFLNDRDMPKAWYNKLVDMLTSRFGVH